MGVDGIYLVEYQLVFNIIKLDNEVRFLEVVDALDCIIKHPNFSKYSFSCIECVLLYRLRRNDENVLF